MFRNTRSIAFFAVCGVLLLAELFYDKHTENPWEKLFGSYALVGLLGSFALVLIARAVGLAIVREEHYYDR